MKTAEAKQTKETSAQRQTPMPVTALPETPSQPPALPAPQHRSRWWVYAILFVAICGFGVFVALAVIASKNNAAAVADKRKAAHDLPVVIVKAHVGNMNQYLVGLGTVTPLSTVTLKSRVDGAITEIHFKEGLMVKEGDFLIQIDPRPYDAALKQAQGQLAKDAAVLDSAEWTVKADNEAIKTHGITEQQLHIDTATRDQDKGAIEVDNANIDTAKLNLTYAHITSPITGKIGLRLVDLGNIVHATDTTGLAVITQLQPITVVFTLPEDDIPQLQARVASGQSLTVDAYDRGLTKKIATGTVLAIDNEIDPTTGTLKIKAKFDNDDNLLYPSQFVNARMLVNTVQHAVLVPTAAIQHSPTSTFAYVLVPDPPDTSANPATAPADDAASKGNGSGKGGGKGPPGIKGTVKMQNLVVGPSQAAIGPDGADTTVILSGLDADAIVVTDGVDKLQDGTKVVGREAPPAERSHPTTGPATRESTTQPAGEHRHHSPQGNAQ